MVCLFCRRRILKTHEGVDMAILNLFLILMCGVKLGSCAQWNITIFIDGRTYAESVDTAFLDVIGTQSNHNKINLGGNFEKGEERSVVVDANFGKINNVRIYQLGEDGFAVQKIVMSDGNRQYTFTCDCWVQTDNVGADSQPSWILNTTDCFWNDLQPYCAEMQRVSCQTGKCKTCINYYQLDGTACIFRGLPNMLPNKELNVAAIGIGIGCGVVIVVLITMVIILARRLRSINHQGIMKTTTRANISLQGSTQSQKTEIDEVYEVIETQKGGENIMNVSTSDSSYDNFGDRTRNIPHIYETT